MYDPLELASAMERAREVTGRIVPEADEHQAQEEFSAWASGLGLTAELYLSLDLIGNAVWVAEVVTARGRVGGPISDPTQWRDKMRECGLWPAP